MVTKRRMITESEPDRYMATGIYLDGGPQLYLNKLQATRQPIVFEAKTAELTRCYSVADARRRWADIVAEREAARQERAMKKKANAEPVPVSVVSMRNSRDVPTDGDYLLAGFHATNKTPLLRNLDGSPTGYSPSNLSSIDVLERLSEQEWDQWREFKDVLLTAQSRDDALDDLKPGSWRLNPAPNQMLEMLTYSRHDEPNVAVTWSLDVDGERFVSVAGGQRYVGETLEELSTQLMDVLHPDLGKDVLVVTSTKDSDALSFTKATFVHSDYARHNSYREDWYLGLTEEEYMAVHVRLSAAKAAKRTFITDHRFNPEETS